MKTPLSLEEIELDCARAAERAVREAGGFLSFTDYDARMISRENPIIYFPPISWCQGWGNPVLLKKNQDKLCAFAAVRAKLLIQRDGGYAIPDQEILRDSAGENS